MNKDLTELEVPYHVQTITQHAFLSCLFLAKVEFPAGTQLTKICKEAFYGCGVKSIRIPRTVTYIEEFAFENCSFLKCIEVPLDTDLQKVGPSLLELNEKIVRYSTFLIEKQPNVTFRILIFFFFFGLNQS